MESDREIGRVLNVDSFRVVIEIDKENKSLTKAHYTGICPVARINSYVIIPVGYEKIVGHVTKVQMFSETSEVKNVATITLPDVKRLIWATMIGTIKKRDNEEIYEQGITSYPSLDNPVYFILKEELDCIFDKRSTFDKNEYEKGIRKKYYVPIGKSTAFPEYEVKLDPDALFSKHLAVLGNTGSGKSCTIVSLIQTILQKKYADRKIENAHFIIFDTNGEYSNAFIRKNEDKADENIGDCFVINHEGLKIPYWFMNFEDFKTLFNPSEKTQEPILNAALSLARQSSETAECSIILKCFLIDLEAVNEQISSTDKPSSIKKAVYDLCSNLIAYLNENKDYLSSKISFYDEIKDKLEELKNACPDITNQYATTGIPTQSKKDFITWYEPRILELDKLSNIEIKESIDVDRPSYFAKDKLLISLKTAIKILGESIKRLSINEYLATLKLRINRFFTDERYDFLFHNYDKFPYALATFLRYCFGRMKNAKYDEFDSDGNGEKKGTPPFLDYYLKTNQTDGQIGFNHQIVIFDMSLLASDIIENITALLGRLILEFLQRMGKDKEERGKFPVVLILEEAHNYIPEKKKGQDKDSISKIIFERIAREGRKYGLSLVVSSQRPSELSKTVLSQCNSFIVHRIQNPEDQKYIRTIVPSINEDFLRQLPSLAQRTALIFGDCVRAPAQVYINEANPLPDSKDPKFMKHWLQLDPDAKEEPDFERICEEWEGKNIDSEKENTNEE